MKRFLLVVVLALAAILGLLAIRRAQHPKPSDAQPAIPVAVAHARIEDVPLTVDGIGTVQALNTVNIRPMVSGPLVEIRFHEGQDVHAGDILARIDSRTYQAAYDQATGKLAQDQALLENARRDLARYEKLAKTQYTTAQQADTQRSLVAQDEAQLRQDQAAIDTARTNLSYTNLTSPVDGRTGVRQVDIGNIVTSADATPLTVVTTLRPIAVLFTLPQQDLPEVTAAMQAAGPAGPDVAALPPDGGIDPATGAANPTVLDRGHLRVLDNEVDSATGTIKLKAIFPNPALRLWPGAFVNVRLSLRVDRNVVTVPAEAIQRGPQGAFVFLLTPGNTALRHGVTVARQTETVAIVSQGLSAGDAVVTDGASRLTDGSKVRLIEE